MKFKVKLACVLYIMLLVVLVAGCGKKESNAEYCVEQIFYYLSKGDFERGLEYCKEESSAYNTLNENTQENILISFGDEFVDTPELIEYFESDRNFMSLFQTYKDYMFDGYEILNSYEESDKKVIVNVKAERIDDSKIYMADLGIMIADYYYTNYEQVNKIYEVKGEAAMVVEILENISTKYCQVAKDGLIKNASYIECEYAISVEKVNNEWLVTEITRISE